MATDQNLQNELVQAQLLHAELQAQLHAHTEHGLLTGTTDNSLGGGNPGSTGGSSSSSSSSGTGLNQAEQTPTKGGGTPGMKPNKRKLMDLLALDDNFHWVKRDNVYKREVRARAQAIVDSGTTTWDGPPNIPHLHGVVLRGTGSATTVSYNADGTPSTSYPTFNNGAGAYIYYEANIWLDTQSLTLGCFKTRLEAAVAFDYAQTYLRPSLRSGSGKLLTLNFAGTPSDCRVYGPLDPWPASVLALNLPLPAHNPDGFGGHVLIPHPEDEATEKRPARARYDQVQLDPNDPMAFINTDDVMAKATGTKRRKRQSKQQPTATETESSSLLAQMDQLPNANLVSSYPLVSIPIDPNDPNNAYYYANTAGLQAQNGGQMITYNYNPNGVATPETENPPKKTRRRSKATADASNLATASSATNAPFGNNTYVMYNPQQTPVVNPQYGYGYAATYQSPYIYQTGGNSFLTTTTNPDGSTTTTTTTTTVPNVVDNRPPEGVNYTTVPSNNSYPLIIQTMPNGQPTYYTTGPSGVPMPATTTYVIVSPTSVAIPGTTVANGATNISSEIVSNDPNRPTDSNATTTILSSTADASNTGVVTNTSVVVPTNASVGANGTTPGTVVYQSYPPSNYNYSYYPMPSPQILVNSQTGTAETNMATTSMVTPANVAATSSSATTTLSSTNSNTAGDKTTEQDQGYV